MSAKLKSVLINLGLCLVSTVFFVVTMELVFPKILHKLPLSIYLGLGKDYKILGQYHKKSVIPTDYIALVGDSHALGSGDWYLEAVRNHKLTQGDYHTAHILFNETGRDILSFGALGSGSLRGLVLKPISTFKYINSLRDFKLKQPKEILIYFYEGNDLSDNSGMIYHRFRPKYDMDQFYDPEYFKVFIEKELLEVDPIFTGEVLYKNLLFSRFLVESVSDNVYNELRRGINKLKKFILENSGVITAYAIGIQVSPDFSGKVSKSNSDLAVVGGMEFPFPRSTQHPALSMDKEKTMQAFYVFEQSLRYMADFFNQSKITIIYIPSPISVYKWVSPTVTIDIGLKLTYPSAKIYQRSDEIFKHMETIARKYDYPLVDTQPSLRAIALKEPVHGPRDWFHPNQKGYEAIAQAILQNTAFNNGESK